MQRLAYSKFLRSELPALIAAKASLATVVTSLSTVLPHLQLCQQPPDSMRSPLNVNQTVTKLEAVPSHAAWSVSLSQSDLLAGMSVRASVVEQPNGIDLEEARLLLSEARVARLPVRAAHV